MHVFPLFRLARRTWLVPALLGFPSVAAAQQFASFTPADPRIAYSDYACSHVSAERASFDRDLVGNWLCYQEQMSPGVRATFLVDASHIRFELEYFFAGFLCGTDVPVPLSWEFGLIVDGVRKPTGARNPLYPLTLRSTPWVDLGTGAGPHRVTLVWPAGADVDLVAVHLMQALSAASPTLLTPTPRVQPLVSVFGDSITQGLAASHVLNTLPARLGILEGWKVINLGFAGRTTVATDAWLAAGFPLCQKGVWADPPDLLILAIGSNDFHSINDVHTKLDRFEVRYGNWIDQFRALRPATPILCLTPLPRGDECQIATRTLEEYREAMRAVIEARADPRIYLFEGRDLIEQTPSSGDPLFDALLLHPTDLGFEQIAARLSRFNLIRNPGFETRPTAACREISELEPYLWTDLGPGVSRVQNGPNGSRVLALSASGSRAQLVYGLSAGDRFTLEASGHATSTSNPGRITLEFLAADGTPVAAPLVLSMAATTWRRYTRAATIPAGTLRTRIQLSLGNGPGPFLLDDLALTVAEF